MYGTAIHFHSRFYIILKQLLNAFHHIIIVCRYLIAAVLFYCYHFIFIDKDLLCIVETLLKYSTAVADAGTNAPASEWSTETAQRIVDLREQPDEMLYLRSALTGKKVRTIRVFFEYKLGDGECVNAS